jgi:hypothetical protein
VARRSSWQRAAASGDVVQRRVLQKDRTFLGCAVLRRAVRRGGAFCGRSHPVGGGSLAPRSKTRSASLRGVGEKAVVCGDTVSDGNSQGTLPDSPANAPNRPFAALEDRPINGQEARESGLSAEGVDCATSDRVSSCASPGYRHLGQTYPERAPTLISTLG